MAGRATILELTVDHLVDAARLLAERHTAQRLVQPGLDPAYEDPAAARAEIVAVLDREGASGVAAVAGDRVDGFLAGARRLLGERILAWARDAGYPAIVTDWRMTNLTSSRTWPRLGFRPTFYRLFRGIA